MHENLRNPIFPPPLIWLFCAILIKITPKCVAFSVPVMVIVVVILLATVLAIMGLWQFYQAKTSINPLNLDRTSMLVTTGIYRISRHPMYLSLLLLLIAWWLWWGNGGSVIVLPLFVYVINTWQIRAEEERLMRLFGQAYKDYCMRVRRWI